MTMDVNQMILQGIKDWLGNFSTFVMRTNIAFAVSLMSQFSTILRMLIWNRKAQKNREVFTNTDWAGPDTDR